MIPPRMPNEEIYLRLGTLLGTFPTFEEVDLSRDNALWLAHLGQLVRLVGDMDDQVTLRTMSNRLTRLSAGDLKERTVGVLHGILVRTLVAAEFQIPAGQGGAFIPAGNAFDAMAAVSRVLREARNRVLIVDPYMDAKALMDFSVHAAERVPIDLLADARTVKEDLKPSLARWRQQYADARPVEVRLSPARTLHDRLIILDGQQVFSLTQSLNAFAARSPASILRVDAENAALKVEAYTALWDAATVME